jgi:zinc protease
MQPRKRAAVSAVLPLPRPGDSPLPKVPVPQRFTLDNGLRVAAVPWGALPQIVVKLVVPAGSVCDQPGAAGTAGLVGRLLTEGTGGFTAEALNARLDQLGSAVDVQVGHDFAEIEMFLLSETLEEALPLLGEFVVAPTFPAHEVERARYEVLDALAGREDEPANVADDRTAAAVFGDEHSYGRPALGTEEGINSVNADRLHAFHAAMYRPQGSFLIAAGDLQPERLAGLLDAVLGGWRGVSQAPAVAAAPPEPAAAGRRIDVGWRDAQQAEIRVGGVGLPRKSPDWIPAAVANFILGGSTITGRLGANLREDKGWTYGARSGFSAGLAAGGWMAETAVDVEVREAALLEMVREIERIATERVSADELARAHDALVLSLPRAFETPGRVVSRFTTLEAFGLPDDYWQNFPNAVRSVDRETVREVAGRYLAPDRLVRVVVG